jgi:hypothetical protein
MCTDNLCNPALNRIIEYRLILADARHLNRDTPQTMPPQRRLEQRTDSPGEINPWRRAQRNDDLLDY